MNKHKRVLSASSRPEWTVARCINPQSLERCWSAGDKICPRHMPTTYAARAAKHRRAA